MTDRHAIARSYLAPPAQSFWRWSGDGEVVEWADGKTIAFRQEVEHVLARLAPHGLPPFGAVVLLLAACREGWVDTGDERGLLYGFVRWLSEQGLKVGHDWLTGVIAGLDAMHALPQELRSPLEAKAVLAELVFDGARHRWPPADAAQLLKAIAEGINPDALLPDPVKKSALEWFRIERNTLVHGLKRVDAETLRLRARTGLDRLVKPAEIDLPPAERVRQLIRELRRDKELAGLGRLAHDLMAAVHIPRAISAPDELPVGGVSDIANRGPLDRLLVSELAHDDLTLAVRIALNEALYLRRETPPRTPPSCRMILIDSGIRLWGVPRVFATAVALALAATANRHTQFVAYRAAAGGFVPVDLTCREGLEKHLEALEPSPHPATSLASFFTQADRSSGLADRILVTHEDVLADPEFRAALRSIDANQLYVAAVSRDGSFRMLAVTGHGQKLLRAARLSLDDLLTPPKVDLPGVPLVSETFDASLPLILTVDPFPLLLSQHVDPRNVRFSEQHGAVGVTTDGRLMHWRKPGRGARQLTAQVPVGQVRWFSLEDSVARLVIENEERELHYLSADLDSGECRAVHFPVERRTSLAICCQGEVLFRVFHDRVDVFGLSTGEPIQVLPSPPKTLWKSDRFFRSPDGWLALSYDGLKARFDPVKIHPLEPTGTILLFDRAGHDGPWGLTSSGDVFCTLEGKLTYFKHGLAEPVEPLKVSPDGNRVAIRSARRSIRSHDAQPPERVLDLKTGKTETTANARLGLLDPAISRMTRTRSQQRHFRGISIDARGQLVLVTQKHHWLSIGLPV